MAAIGELAAMVGHDLRNPLTGIAGATYYLKTLIQPKTGTKTLEMLETIENDVARSDKIVSDLLDYSKELRLDLKETSLSTIAAKALSLVNMPENIKVIQKVRNKNRVTVDVDQMKRVFINLIKNSVDAMPDGGKIVIQIDRKGKFVRVRIADTGTGIPKEAVKKLWKPLFTTKAKGMGFGLAICKRIVEAHKGSISLESTGGKGTTVTVKIPATTEKHVSKPKKSRVARVSTIR